MILRQWSEWEHVLLHMRIVNKTIELEWPLAKQSKRFSRAEKRINPVRHKARDSFVPERVVDEDRLENEERKSNS